MPIPEVLRMGAVALLLVRSAAAESPTVAEHSLTRAGPAPRLQQCFDFGWPNIGWCCSPIDTCGRQKDYSYFIQSVYSDRPMVRIVVRDPKAPVLGKYGWHWPPVRSHWNWDGYDGPLEVFTFANAASVELLLNGKSLDAKRLADFANRMIRWEVPNEPGTTRAVARDERGAVVARHELRTAGPPARLEVTSDRTVLAADGQDLAHVTVRVEDRSGNLVPHGEHTIGFTLEGNGQMAGVDNGNLSSHESFKASQRATYQGRALAIVRVGRGGGILRLSAVTIEARPARSPEER